MRDLFDFVKEAGPIFLFIVVLIAVPALIGGYYLSKSDCNNYGEIVGREVRHDMISGCYVMEGGRFVHRSQIRKVELTND
jgi:hypothetical protein